MYLTNTTHNRLFQSGDYYVITNPRPEIYEEADLTLEDHLPNYLIVNQKTMAIEFYVDQLPSAFEIAKRLSGDSAGTEQPEVNLQ